MVVFYLIIQIRQMVVSLLFMFCFNIPIDCLMLYFQFEFVGWYFCINILTIPCLLLRWQKRTCKNIYRKAIWRSHGGILILHNSVVQNYNVLLVTSTSVKQTWCYSVHLLIMGVSDCLQLLQQRERWWQVLLQQTQQQVQRRASWALQG